MTRPRVALASLSLAMDGGFAAIADVSDAMSAAAASGDYRLIGGVAVMLHVQRLGLDLPLRTTGDADIGVPPHILRRPDLVTASRSPPSRRRSAARAPRGEKLCEWDTHITNTNTPSNCTTT